MATDDKTAQKRGRPRIDYDKDYHCLLIEGLLKDGKTEYEAAEIMELSISTFKRWKKNYPEFLNAVKKGKEPVNYKIVNSMINAAIGFEYEEVKTYLSTDDKGKKVTRIEKTKKYYPPNTEAGKFMLKNRMPESYRDKQEIDQTNKNIDIKDEQIINKVIEKLKDL